MRSDGGMAALKTAARRPATLIESGPASGVIGAAYLGRALGLQNVLSFDMGGTTAKAGTIFGGVPEVSASFEAAGSTHSGRSVKGSGYPVRFPFVDLAEVSAGGGTIAWNDAAGTLRVGPISAGADPGPGLLRQRRPADRDRRQRRAAPAQPARAARRRVPDPRGPRARAVASVSGPLGGDAERTAAGHRRAGRRRDGQGAAHRLGRARARPARLHPAGLRRRRAAARLRGRGRHRRRADRRARRAGRVLGLRAAGGRRARGGGALARRAGRRRAPGSAPASCSTRWRAKATRRWASRAWPRPSAASCASWTCATSASRPTSPSARRARSKKRSRRSTPATSSATASPRGATRSRSSPRGWSRSARRPSRAWSRRPRRPAARRSSARCARRGRCSTARAFADTPVYGRGAAAAGRRVRRPGGGRAVRRDDLRRAGLVGARDELRQPGHGAAGYGVVSSSRTASTPSSEVADAQVLVVGVLVVVGVGQRQDDERAGRAPRPARRSAPCRPSCGSRPVRCRTPRAARRCTQRAIAASASPRAATPPAAWWSSSRCGRARAARPPLGARSSTW